MSRTYQSYVILYHGTPYENKDNILKYGIQYKKPDIERLLKQAIRDIRAKLGKKFRFKTDYVVDRLMESTKRGGIVYVSGNFDYAYSNALASKEWLMSLLEQAFYKLPEYRKLDEERREIARKCLKLQEKLQKLDEELRRLSAEGKDVEYLSVSSEAEKVWRELVKCEEIEYSKAVEKQREYEAKIRRLFFDTKAVVFKIKIPINQLEKLLADDFSKGIFKKVKEGIIDMEMVDELHLKEVPRKYIVGYKVVKRETLIPVKGVK